MSTLQEMGIKPMSFTTQYDLYAYYDEEYGWRPRPTRKIPVKYIPSMQTIHVWGTHYTDKLPILTRKRLGL